MDLKNFLFLILISNNFVSGGLDFELSQPQIYVENGHLYLVPAVGRNLHLISNNTGKIYFNSVELNILERSIQNTTRDLKSFKRIFGNPTNQSRSSVTSRLRSIERAINRIEGFDDIETRLTNIERLIEYNLTSTGNEGSGSGNRRQKQQISRLKRRVTRIENRLNNVNTLAPNPCSSSPCQNSGTCIPTIFGAQCLCTSGWEGDLCQIDVNECNWLRGSDLGCQNGATCINTPGDYRCQCTAGYIGIHCTKRSGDCSSGAPWELCGHGICVNQHLGSRPFTCICDQGWKTDGQNPACTVDVDECTSGHTSCSKNPPVACINVPGSFHCGQCPSGYTGNGFYCNDINECLVNNGGCSQNPMVQCINTQGSRTCGECPAGYIGNGISCQYAGICQINNGGCHPLARCSENPVISQSYVQCQCPAGYTGTGLGLSGCFPYGGNINPVNSPCNSNPCQNGVCNAIGPSYTCSCYPGFIGQSCNVRLDPCQPSNPCLNGGTCSSNSNGGFTCTCPNDFTGNLCQTQEQSCGGNFETEFGHLKFPHSGSTSYSNSASCVWILRTTRGKVLSINFTSFNLEGTSTDCVYDWLQIHDGMDTTAPLLGRFCGHDLPKGGVFSSTHEVLYFWFWSDHSTNGLGFEFNWNTTEPECGGHTFGETHGVVSSPGYPGHYPNDRDCYWSINVNSGKRIQLAFANMRLESHPNCSYDYVEIRDGSEETSPLLARYCNSTLPAPITSSTSHISIRFHSDHLGTDSGFHVTFVETQGIPGCGGLLTSEIGVFSSPHHPEPYGHMLDCEWIIRLPHDDRISLKFLTFEIESVTHCAYDYVEIRDGNSIESPLVGRFCGSNPPQPFISTGNFLFVHFRSDESISLGGFSAKYEAVCGGLFSEQTGTIRSPYYPENYPRNRECIYIISLPVGKGIRLQFQDFHIESGVDTRCHYDYLEIRDGDTENSTLLGHFCGPSQSVEEPIISSYNYLWLKFKTDGTVQNRGFLANYTSYDVGCGGIFKQTHGLISSPAHPEVYPHGVNCRWVISGNPGQIIRLSWVTFSLETSTTCSFDKIEVYDNSTQFPNGTLMGRFCGNDLPPALTSSDRLITVKFTSDESVAHDGFLANFVLLNASSICGGNFFSEYGIIKSPAYPEEYPNGKTCIWVIKAPHGQQIKLNVTDFDMENGSSSTQCYDYLEMRNGIYSSSPLIGKFCGNNKPPRIIPSHANGLYLKFVSDGSRRAKGFQIKWDGTSTGCGGTLSSPSGSIISPNYPMALGQAVECIWTISVNKGSAVQFIFVDLDLTASSSRSCYSQHVELRDGAQRNSPILGKYCHSDSPLSINSTGNTLVVKFYAAFGGSGRGFHAKYETICNRYLNGYRGVIESPNFPKPYPHNRNCSWEILAPLGNKINISFSHFEIEGPSRYSNHCSYDYLEIRESHRLSSGTNETSLGKYCGSEYPPLISSNLDRVLIRFESDMSMAMNGFRLEWVINGCGGHFRGGWNYFSTPNYPRKYRQSVECEWFVESEIGTKVQLTIFDLDIEAADNCRFDYLRVYGGVDEFSPRLTELCHSITHSMVLTSHGNNMFIKFFSDGTITGKGFYAYTTQVGGGCGGIFSTPQGSIYSPNYPKDYDHDDECSWIITVDDNHIVQLTFEDFNVEFHTNCTFDGVSVYDGPSMQEPLLMSHCGNSLPSPAIVKSTGNSLYIRFKSDGSSSAKGFKANWITGCGARLIDRREGEIISPGFPNYVRDLNCSWIIMSTNPEDRVILTFTHLDIQTSTSNTIETQGSEAANCGTSDFVTVLDGIDDEAPSLGTFCLTKIPPSIVSRGQGLLVRIQTEHGFGVGFRAVYQISTSSCGMVLTSAHGSFISPNYPIGYPPNTECVWTLQASRGNRIQLSFLRMDIESSDFCNTDFVEIHEDSLEGPLLGHFCGNQIPANITAAEQLIVLFRSDSEGQAPGFWADYSLLHGNELSGSYGTIESPLYPLPNFYSGEFSWRVTVNESKSIKIQFINFDYEDVSTPEGCRNYMKIYDGYDENSPVIFFRCDGFPSELIFSTGNVIYITSVKTYVNLGSVFRLFWTEISNSDNPSSRIPNSQPVIPGCGGNITLSENSTTLLSPGYLNFSYEPNLNCEWIFKADEHYKIQIKIEDLELESHALCSYDKIEFWDGYQGLRNFVLNKTACQRNEVGTILESSGSWLKIVFKSDTSYNLRGFNLTLSSICGGWLRESRGLIKSPNYPNNYGHTRCQWVIQVKPGRTIKLEFQAFDIYKEASGDCSTDKLMIRNGGNRESPFLGQGRYCGNNIPVIPESITNQLFLSLSTYTAGGKGFSLIYNEVSVGCGGQIHLTHDVKDFTFTSPNFPTMPPPFTECEWVFTGPQNEILQLDFLQFFQIFVSPGCTRAGVEIRDGGTQLSPLIQTICRNMPGTIKSTGNVLYIRYYTNVNEPKNGFKAKASIGQCGGTLIANWMSNIASPGFPNHPLANLDCLWTIKAPQGSFLILRFIDFFLGPADTIQESNQTSLTPNELCSENNDYLLITEANLTNFASEDGEIEEILNPRNWTFCKNTPESSIPNSISTSFNQIRIRFKTSTQVQSNSRGFKMSYRVSSERCGGFLTASSGEFQSPGYRRSYSHHRRCRWQIKAPEGRRIRLEFLDFDFEPRILMPSGSQFCVDYILVEMTSSSDNTRLYNKTLCGSSLPEPVESTGGTLLVSFGTDGSVSHRGFKAKWSTDLPAICGGNIEGDSGFVTSAMEKTGTPNTTTYVTCSWTHQGDPNNGTTIINLIDVQIPPWAPNERKHCSRGDGILKFLGQRVYTYQAQTFCGKVSNTKLYIPGQFFKIEYLALHWESKFNLSYQIVQCGGLLTGESNVSSPNYPNSYPENTECIWVLKHSYYQYNSHVRVKFTDLDLPSDGNCENSDYIIVRNGEHSYSPIMGTYCGSSSPSPYLTMSDEIWIEFHSDGNDDGNKKGFRLELEYVTFGCGGILHAKLGSIKSPKLNPNDLTDDSSRYPHNSECEWTIESVQGYSIMASFTRRFDIEISTNCSNDYVEIFTKVEDNWISKGRFCGKAIPPLINTTSSSLKVKFHSNNQINGDGFQLNWWSKCGSIYQNLENGLIRSAHYDSLNHSIRNYNIWSYQGWESNWDVYNCKYEIKGNSTEDFIVVEFQEPFEVTVPSVYQSYHDPDINCPYVNVSLTDSNALGLGYRRFARTRSSGYYCGRELPAAFIGRGSVSINYNYFPHYQKTLPLPLLSLSTMAGERNLQFTVKCGGNITEPGVISSPGHPFTSAPNMNCTWFIRAPPGKVVRIKFEKLELEYSISCNYDFVKLFEGLRISRNESLKIGTFCGNMTDDYRRISSATNEMTLQFFTDYSVQHSGFKAAIDFTIGKNQGCGGKINASSSTTAVNFRSPRNAGKYLNYLDCQWLVVGGNYEILELDFTSFQLEGGRSRVSSANNASDPCPFDFIKIYDGVGPSDPLLGTFCGNQIPPRISSSRNFLWINFVTDGVNTFSGFDASLISRPSPCGGTFVLNATTTPQILNTPNFPEPYPHNLRCQWTVDGARLNDEIDIRFIDLNIETSPDCTKDRLQIQDISTSYTSPEGYTGPILFTGRTNALERSWRFRHLDFFTDSLMQNLIYCGTQVPPDFFSIGRSAKISFNSDSFNSGRGFKIEYKSAGCNRTYESYQGRIFSPEWPTHSPIFTNCIFTIKTPNNTFASIYFNSFMVSDSEGCSESALEVREGSPGGRLLAKICGSARPNPIFSNGNLLWLSYFTRITINRGFDLTFASSTTIPGCGGDIFHTGGALSSPRYPGPPSQAVDCRWRIRVPGGLRIQIQFLTFQPGSDCNTDFVEIFSMNSHETQNDPVLFSRFCAGDIPARYDGSTDMAMIRYSASSNHSGIGWFLDFKGILPTQIADLTPN